MPCHWFCNSAFKKVSLGYANDLSLDAIPEGCVLGLTRPLIGGAKLQIQPRVEGQRAGKDSFRE
jgi:hypothetical protein